METFGEKLKQFIEENGYSIRKFALECDFDRPWLTNIINSKKKMPAVRFEKIIQSGIFNNEQAEKLRYVYYSDNYTDAEFERIKYIIKRFGKSGRSECIKPVKIENDKRTHYGKLNVLSVLYYLLEQEEQFYYIYTNIPASSKKVIDIIYNFVKQKSCKDYKHIMFTDSGVSTNNLNTLFTICDFAEIGYDISVLSSINIGQLEEYNFFPYYIIVNNKMLLFDSKFNNVNINTDMQKIAIYQQKFIDLYDKSRVVTYHFDNAVNLMRHMSSAKNGGVQMSLSNALCVTRELDYNILKSNINPMLPNKEPLIKAVLNHYNQDYSDYTQFIIPSSVTNFAKDGIIHEMPEDYLLPIDIESRIQLLTNIKSNIENHSTFLINPAKIDYKFNDISLNCQENVTICGYNNNSKSSNNSFCGEWLCVINNKTIYNDFKNTKEFIINNRCIYDKEYAVGFIDNVISELKAFF